MAKKQPKIKVDPEKSHLTLMLGSIYNTIMDMTPRQTISYFLLHPEDTQLVRDYLARAKEVEYEPKKIAFLQAIENTCLHSNP